MRSVLKSFSRDFGAFPTWVKLMAFHSIAFSASASRNPSHDFFAQIQSPSQTPPSHQARLKTRLLGPNHCRKRQYLTSILIRGPIYDISKMVKTAVGPGVYGATYSGVGLSLSHLLPPLFPLEGVDVANHCFSDRSPFTNSSSGPI